MQEKKQFYKKLAVLVLPIAVQNLMTALVSASDALMLGFLDQSLLSAVSLATQVQFVLNLFYAALTIGSTVLAAQYWGKGDFRSVEKILAAALKSALLVSVVFFFAALAVPELLMRIFGLNAVLIFVILVLMEDRAEARRGEKAVCIRMKYLRKDDPVLTVYFLLNLDELIKLPAVYRHYRQYRWVRDLTR